MHFLLTAHMIAGLPCRQGQPHLGANCSLSPPQSGQAMEEFIQESLAAGIICPSSPAGAGFFMEKKDKSLCPCIDYWGLNNITRTGILSRSFLQLLSSWMEWFILSCFLWPRRWPRPWLIMFLEFMASWRTWSPTGAPISCPSSARSSVLCCGPPSVCYQVFTLNPNG